MKKMISLVCVVLLCVSMSCVALAADDTFVPSISYKDGPVLVEATMDGEGVDSCVVITSLTDAKEKSTDLSQEARELLLKVYEELEEGTMTLPLENDYVIRELVDISFAENGCVVADHGKDEWLDEEENTIELVLDLGVPKDMEITVLVYVDEEWLPVEEVENNGDGTLTCIFEQLCPVAFCVETPAPSSSAGSSAGISGSMGLWVGIAVVALGAVAVLLTVRSKKKA